MSKPLAWLHRSVFARLMAIMLGLGLVIPVTVGSFVMLVARPTLTGSYDGLMAEYVELLAARSPSLEEARAAAGRQLAVRWEGGDGRTWATREGMPSVAEAEASPPRGLQRVVRRPDGSAYLFAWDSSDQLSATHDRMLMGLLVIIMIIVSAGYTLLRRTLDPLRHLQAGVAALSEGNLEVVVPRKSDDELGQLADAFNRMVGRVREMVRSRDQLLLDVSHELRSPLTRIKVALELGPDDAHKERLARDVAEMEGMVMELLELERLRQGRGLELERRDLMEVVRESVTGFKDRAPGVVLGDSPTHAVLDIDAGKVRRVLDNLLENASKYSLPDSGPVRVSVAERDGKVLVTVEDDGPGIPAEDLPSLFEPFFRVDRSRSRKTGGYGLGLSLCKRIVEAHGGSITAEHRPGRGACFRITFPKG